ncbi:unnamed protein product, partial [Brenthis ino]
MILHGLWVVSLEDADKIPKGLLSPACILQYNRIVLTRNVPPRDFHYYHEYLAGNPQLEEVDEDFRWRIVGGKRITIQEAPYQVLYGKYCGGTLIAPDWVLTAAHCKTKAENVYAGSTSRSEAKEYPICAHFIHPYWETSNQQSHDYDYQLLLLEKPIPDTSASRPIAIGSVNDIKDGNMVSVTGWGYLKFKANKMQDILRRVHVPIINEEKCKEMTDGSYDNITSRMFCAGYANGTKDSCQGDSGGPVVYQGKLLGLVSYGLECALPNHPGVYANVPKVRGWIRSVTALPL